MLCIVEIKKNSVNRLQLHKQATAYKLQLSPVKALHELHIMMTTLTPSPQLHSTRDRDVLLVTHHPLAYDVITALKTAAST